LTIAFTDLLADGIRIGSGGGVTHKQDGYSDGRPETVLTSSTKEMMVSGDISLFIETMLIY
jgi:hypothetical protein